MAKRRKKSQQINLRQAVVLVIVCIGAALGWWKSQPESSASLEDVPAFSGAPYVELNENKCEGLVPIRDLDDDYYEFDDKNYCLLGRRTRRIYRLGDTITVKVAQANLERKQLDFALV